MESIIAPIDDQSENVTEISEKISKWHADNKFELPKKYINFLGKYNGGYIYPNVFKLNANPENYNLNDTTVFFDIAYDWDYANELWGGDIYFEGTPKGFFFLGSDPGSLELLISLREKDHGHVYAWFHSDAKWGGSENNETHLIHQAASFEDFIHSLHDTTDLIGRSHWETPKALELSKTLKI